MAPKRQWIAIPKTEPILGMVQELMDTEHRSGLTNAAQQLVRLGYKAWKDQQKGGG